jgi:hypothetical protein
MNGTADLNEVIDRLRASKRKFENEQYQAGHEAGQDWAKDEAEAGELICLSNARHQIGTDWDDHFSDNEVRSAYSASELFTFIVWPEHDGDRSSADDFWERRGFEGDHPVGEYVRGFSDGALSIWDQVSHEL